MLTINGRIQLQRQWWHGAQIGSIAPADEILNRSGATITPGVLELACRENLSATSFARAAANLARTAQVTLSTEQLHLAELDGLGLDFYHLSENVHRARRAIFGEDAPEGRAWADELMHVFKHEGYGAAWERLVQWRARLARSRKRKAADRLLKYVAARQEMIRYPAFRAKGWQIGSGPTESQCKLCTKRLKGHGRRWDRPNATAVAALDTLNRSGRSDRPRHRSQAGGRRPMDNRRAVGRL